MICLEDMKTTLEKVMSEDYENFVKALISIEKGVTNRGELTEIYDQYLQSDSMGLLNPEIDTLVENVQEIVRNGEKERAATEQEKGSSALEETNSTQQSHAINQPWIQEYKDRRQELINLVGDIVGSIDISSREGSFGKFDVANFTVAFDKGEGKKTYVRVQAFNDKIQQVENFKRGDHVKIFGQIRREESDDGKIYTQVRALKSVLLKAKEQVQEADSKENERSSTIEALNSYKAKAQAKSISETKKDIHRDR